MENNRARFTLLRLTFALSIITYIDRVCVSTAAPDIHAALGLTPSQMGWVFSAFTFAYAVFEIPSGWLGDTLGPRKVLARIVLWWSAFTMATGAVWNYVSLLTARFLFGAGEAGAFPNMSRSLSRWFPLHERGTAHGIIFTGSRLGGAVTPLLVGTMITRAGWRQAFWTFGVLGIVWCVFWWRWFRDDPAKHPDVNAQELQTIRKGLEHKEQRRFDWGVLLSTNLVFICLMYFTMGYTLYFNLTWLPTYLRDVRHFTQQQSGYIAGAVLLTGAVMTAFGGWFTDRLVSKYGLKLGRSIGVITLPVSGLILLAAARAESPVYAAILLAATLGVADICVSS